MHPYNLTISVMFHRGNKSIACDGEAEAFSLKTLVDSASNISTIK